MTSNQLLELVGILNSELLWVYFIVVIITFYAIIALLTWNIKKPLIFLGIPSIIVGILLIILKFSIGLFIPNKSLLALLNSAVKPLFTIGIICIIVGVAMIILYKVLNKMKKRKEAIQETEI